MASNSKIPNLNNMTSFVLQCNHCWNDLTTSYFVTRCNHVFCERDAGHIFSREMKCPACQRDLQESDIHEIHLPVPTHEILSLQKKWVQFKRVQAEKRLQEVQQKWSIREDEIKSLEENTQSVILNLREELERKDNEIRILRENYMEKTNEILRIKAAYDHLRFGTDKFPKSALTYLEPPTSSYGSSVNNSIRFQSPPKSSGSSSSIGGSRSAFIQKFSSRSMFTPSPSQFSKIESSIKPSPKRPLTPSFLRKSKSSVNNLLFSPPPRKANE